MKTPKTQRAVADYNHNDVLREAINEQREMERTVLAEWRSK